MTVNKILNHRNISIFYQEGRHKTLSEHSHLEHQILFSYTKEFKVFFNNKEVLIPVGKALFIHSGMKHSFEAISEDSLQYFIFITNKYWNEVKAHFQYDLEDLEYFRFSTSEFTKKIMRDVLLSHNEVYQREVSRVLTANLMLEVLKQKNHEMISLSSKDPILNNILHHIEENYRDKITNNDLAQKFGISERSLTRKFKNEFGLTIKQYHLQKKIEKAKEMVKFKDQSLSDIAINLGFSSLSHFLDTYKKYTGLKIKK